MPVTPATSASSQFGKPLRGFALQHATLVRACNSDGHTVLNTMDLVPGNYRLSFMAADGTRIVFSRRGGPRLFLEIVDRAHRIELTGHTPSHGIGQGKLVELLQHVSALNQWGTELTCRLVVADGSSEVYSNDTTFLTPVRPWQGSLDPKAFSEDASIVYVGDPSKHEFFGRDLTSIGPFRCFTYKNVLETSYDNRGFACIGFAAVVRGVKHGPKRTKDSETLARFMNGKAFSVASVPTAGAHFETPDPAWVSIGPALLRAYLKSPAGSVGDYLIWRPGHTGIIRDGFVYECKPPGKGFTNKTFQPMRQSAVCRFTPDEFLADLRGHSPFLVSKLPAMPP